MLDLIKEEIRKRDQEVLNKRLVDGIIDLEIYSRASNRLEEKYQKIHTFEELKRDIEPWLNSGFSCADAIESFMASSIPLMN
jgi:hypothetical protein